MCIKKIRSTSTTGEPILHDQRAILTCKTLPHFIEGYDTAA